MLKVSRVLISLWYLLKADNGMIHFILGCFVKLDDSTFFLNVAALFQVCSIH